MINLNPTKVLSYHEFVKSGGLRKLRRAKQSVIDLEIDKLRSLDSNSFEQKNYLCYVQKIVSYAFNSNLTLNIAFRNKTRAKANLPVPQHWLKGFQDNSIAIDNLGSRVKWVGFIFLLILKAFWSTLRTNFTFESFKLNKFICNQKNNNKEVVLVNPKFPKGNLFRGAPSFDFASWYCNCFMKEKEIVFISFDRSPKDVQTSIRGQGFFWSEFTRFQIGIKFSNKIQLLFYAIKLFFVGCFNLFRSNPSILVNFDDLIFAKRLSYVSKNELPDSFVFSDSHGVLMPYWINTLNRADHLIQYIFFSSYDSPTKYSDEDPRLDFWKLNSWPQIYCVDDYQKTFITNNMFSKSQNVIEIGFPDFTDSTFNFPKSTKPKIALFDFEPGLNHFGISTLSEFGFNSYETNKLFISGIYKVASELGFMIFHKPKRANVLNNRDTEYRKFIENLSSEWYFSIPPETSPARLILETECTICMPISSPGLIALKMAKKSLYYDPLGVINRHDPALRGAQLAKTHEEIKTFLNEVLSGIA
jgi:polysaccharide biosynthesis PFTS motif protein